MPNMHHFPHVGLPSTPRLFAAIALVALSASVARHVTLLHRRRLLEKPRALPERLQVWEDEGGQSQMPGQPPP
jgi:hypothetical protein